MVLVELLGKHTRASSPDKQTQYLAKRLFDIVVASLALLLTVPLFLIISVAVRLTSPGPVLFRQVRIGKDRRYFTLYKFRTMFDGSHGKVDQVFHLNTADGPWFKARNDPRATRVGRILRGTFLDELPQLFNVLRGDMSIVGPRPCLPSEAAARAAQLEFRFAVPQGLTGPWQVNGHHALTFEEQLAVERDYVTNWSLARDLSILLKTVPLVLGVRGS